MAVRLVQEDGIGRVTRRSLTILSPRNAEMMKGLTRDFLEAIRLVDARFLEFDLFRKWSVGDFR
jgi:hypothetical protein